MAQRLGHVHRLETSLRVDPRVVLGARLLELNQLDLEQFIHQELDENPALERLDDSPDPITEEQLLRAVAPYELRPTRDDRELARCLPAEEPPDWTELATAPSPCREKLRAELLPSLPSDLQHVGEYLIGSLDARGYLDTPIEEIALATGAAFEQVELVRRRLLACDPPGSGATSLVECLLAQLGRPEDDASRLVRTIVLKHLNEFASRRTDRIARRYGVPEREVALAFERIAELSPHPFGDESEAGAVVAHRAPAVLPDVVFRRSEFGWEIDVRGAEPTDFRLSPVYRRRLEDLARGSRGDRDEKRHVQAMAGRAEDFLNALRTRRATLRRIANYLLERQGGYIATGRHAFLTPLTRAETAAALDLHESAVSRALQGKFAQLATGEVVGFDLFFRGALRVQSMIAEILENENPDRPLSDEAIARMLAERGVKIARRTVNKYRDRAKMLSSRKRKAA